MNDFQLGFGQQVQKRAEHGGNFCTKLAQYFFMQVLNISILLTERDI